MPTPLAHAASGLIVYGAFAARGGARSVAAAGCRGVGEADSPGERAVLDRLCSDAPKIAALAAVACAADVDYLFGLPWLAPNRFHQGWTHSLAFAVVLSVAILVLQRRWRRGRLAPIPLLALFAAALMHPFLDLITDDTSAPFGIPLLWPLSDDRFKAVWRLFPHVEKSRLAEVFSWHNARVLLFEFALCLPLVLVMLSLPQLRSRFGWKRPAMRTP